MFFKRVIKIRTQLGAAVQRTGKKKKKKTVVAVMERGSRKSVRQNKSFSGRGLKNNKVSQPTEKDGKGCRRRCGIKANKRTK